MMGFVRVLNNLGHYGRTRATMCMPGAPHRAPGTETGGW